MAALPDGGHLVALLLVVLLYVCIAPSLDASRTRVRALLAGTAVLLTARYLWWRFAETS